MDFVDKVLVCVGCGNDFVFTADEQRFFAEKNFINTPRRCKKCKMKRNWQETTASCGACGAVTTVPFTPRHGKPILCRACFQKQRAASPTPVDRTPILEAPAVVLAGTEDMVL